MRFRVADAGALVALVRRQQAGLSISGVGDQRPVQMFDGKARPLRPFRQDLAASRTLARSERCRRVRVAHAGAMATLVRRKGSAAAPDGCSVAVGVVRNPCGPEPSNRGRSTTCVARSERCRRFRVADAGMLRVLVRCKGSAATANSCLTAAGRGGIGCPSIRAGCGRPRQPTPRLSAI